MHQESLRVQKHAKMRTRILQPLGALERRFRLSNNQFSAVRDDVRLKQPPLESARARSSLV